MEKHLPLMSKRRYLVTRGVPDDRNFNSNSFVHPLTAQQAETMERQMQSMEGVQPSPTTPLAVTTPRIHINPNLFSEENPPPPPTPPPTPQLSAHYRNNFPSDVIRQLQNQRTLNSNNNNVSQGVFPLQEMIRQQTIATALELSRRQKVPFPCSLLTNQAQNMSPSVHFYHGMPKTRPTQDMSQQPPMSNQGPPMTRPIQDMSQQPPMSNQIPPVTRPIQDMSQQPPVSNQIPPMTRPIQDMSQQPPMSNQGPPMTRPIQDMYHQPPVSKQIPPITRPIQDMSQQPPMPYWGPPVTRPMQDMSQQPPMRYQISPVTRPIQDMSQQPPMRYQIPPTTRPIQDMSQQPPVPYWDPPVTRPIQDMSQQPPMSHNITHQGPPIPNQVQEKGPNVQLKSLLKKRISTFLNRAPNASHPVRNAYRAPLIQNQPQQMYPNMYHHGGHNMSPFMINQAPQNHFHPGMNRSPPRYGDHLSQFGHQARFSQGYGNNYHGPMVPNMPRPQMTTMGHGRPLFPPPEQPADMSPEMLRLVQRNFNPQSEGMPVQMTQDNFGRNINMRAGTLAAEMKRLMSQPSRRSPLKARKPKKSAPNQKNTLPFSTRLCIEETNPAPTCNGNNGDYPEQRYSIVNSKHGNGSEVRENRIQLIRNDFSIDNIIGDSTESNIQVIGPSEGSHISEVPSQPAATSQEVPLDMTSVRSEVPAITTVIPTTFKLPSAPSGVTSETPVAQKNLEVPTMRDAIVQEEENDNLASKIYDETTGPPPLMTRPPETDKRQIKSIPSKIRLHPGRQPVIVDPVTSEMTTNSDLPQPTDLCEDTTKQVNNNPNNEKCISHYNFDSFLNIPENLPLEFLSEPDTSSKLSEISSDPKNGQNIGNQNNDGEQIYCNEEIPVVSTNTEVPTDDLLLREEFNEPCSELQVTTITELDKTPENICTTEEQDNNMELELNKVASKYMSQVGSKTTDTITEHVHGAVNKIIAILASKSRSNEDSSSSQSPGLLKLTNKELRSILGRSPFASPDLLLHSAAAQETDLDQESPASFSFAEDNSADSGMFSGLSMIASPSDSSVEDEIHPSKIKQLIALNKVPVDADSESEDEASDYECFDDNDPDDEPPCKSPRCAEGEKDDDGKDQAEDSSPTERSGGADETTEDQASSCVENAEKEAVETEDIHVSTDGSENAPTEVIASAGSSSTIVQPNGLPSIPEEEKDTTSSSSEEVASSENITEGLDKTIELLGSLQNILDELKKKEQYVMNYLKDLGVNLSEDGECVMQDEEEQSSISKGDATKEKKCLKRKRTNLNIHLLKLINARCNENLKLKNIAFKIYDERNKFIKHINLPEHGEKKMYTQNFNHCNLTFAVLENQNQTIKWLETKVVNENNNLKYLTMQIDLAIEASKYNKKELKEQKRKMKDYKSFMKLKKKESKEFKKQLTDVKEKLEAELEKEGTLQQNNVNLNMKNWEVQELIDILESEIYKLKTQYNSLKTSKPINTQQTFLLNSLKSDLVSKELKLTIIKLISVKFASKLTAAEEKIQEYINVVLEKDKEIFDMNRDRRVTMTTFRQDCVHLNKKCRKLQAEATAARSTNKSLQRKLTRSNKKYDDIIKKQESEIKEKEETLQNIRSLMENLISENEDLHNELEAEKLCNMETSKKVEGLENDKQDLINNQRLQILYRSRCAPIPALQEERNENKLN